MDNQAESSGSSTLVMEEQKPQSTRGAESPETEVRLTLQKRKNSKKVAFSQDTVDNENLNKKKSKCCCIYEKPHKFDESSSESEGECENCYGHKEKKHPAKPETQNQ